MQILDEELFRDTPFVAIDLDVMDRNIDRMAKLAREAQVKLRPHTKTHKSPYIAERQLQMGACGITTAKLGEAEVMVDHGIDDVLIAFPIVGKRKLQRLSALMKRAEVIVALDDVVVANGINDVGSSHGRKIPVYVDVDTGLHRMGRSPQESVYHILQIAKLPYIEVRGLMSHVGQAYEQDSEEEIRAVGVEDATLLYETRELLRKQGLYVPEISVGATATARFVKEIPFITEMRPGMYVFNDRFVMSTGGARLEDCALRVFATVVAKPTKDRLIIDAGSKTLAKDPFRYGGYGHIVGHDNLELKFLSEEHGIVEVRGSTELQIGNVVEIIPNHVCPVVNLADNLYSFRNGVLERVIPVLARGKNR